MKIQLAQGAHLPVKATAAAAGYDIRANTKGVVRSPKFWMCVAFVVATLGGWQIMVVVLLLALARRASTASVVSTGVILAELEPNTYIWIAPRSGLALRNGIDIGAGVIDADYRGEIKVLLFNHGWRDFHYANGDRVAQLVVTPVKRPEICFVYEVSPTTRDVSGF